CRGRRFARSASASRCRTRARLARSARRPWESTGSCRLLTSRGPEFRFGGGSFLFGSPKLVARLGEIGRDALDLGDDPVERLLQAEVCPQCLEAAGLANLGDHLVRVFVRRLGLLANQLLDLVVGDLDPQLV